MAWTEADRLRQALKRAAKCTSDQPGYTAANSAKALFALVTWETAGDWSTVPKEVEDIIKSMGMSEE